MKKFLLFGGTLFLAITVMNSCKKDAAPAAATFEDLLTGGATATAGKTWVLSKGTYPSDDGGGAVTNDMFALLQIPDTIQKLLGKEYDNEFTFFSDGRYSIDPKNDTVLAATLSSSLGGIVCEWTQNVLGLCGAHFAPVTSATWTLHEEDFTVDALSNPLDAGTPPLHGNVTFTGKKWLSFSQGAYFGILDGSTNSHVIIKEVTKTEMHVALLVCMYQGVMNPGGLEFAGLPTHIFQLTYVPKAK